jgi:mono/diheme cytochrome c family protein
VSNFLMMVSMIVVLGATCPLRTGMAERSATTSTTCLLTHSLTAQHCASCHSHSGEQLPAGPAGVATPRGRALWWEQPR